MSQIIDQQPKSVGRIQHKLAVTLVVIALLPLIGLVTALIVAPAFSSFQAIAIGAAIVCQLAGVGLGCYFVAAMVKQTLAINKTLSSINQGDFEARADRITNDELGSAAAKINALCDNTLNLIQSNDERDNIQNSIENLIAEMKEIAAGDLTIETEVNPDITGALAESFNHMTAQLRSIVRRIQSAAQQVTATSGTIRDSSAKMSQESQEQSSRISDASEQLLTLNRSFEHVADLTQQSAGVAIDARQTAADGLKAVSNTVEGMQRIRVQVQGTSKRVKRLGETSQQIGEIVQMISDIADRTSVLALNASIQAALAGDAGHGFAVVAEEIECLAERSTDATKQISKLIRTIQNETGEVTSDMDEAIREVIAGSELAAQAGTTLFEIDSVSDQLVELIQTSSASALEQADQATNIANSMSRISQSTKISAEKNHEATRSVGQLADLVNQLCNSVSQFKVASLNSADSAMADSVSISNIEIKDPLIVPPQQLSELPEPKTTASRPPQYAVQPTQSPIVKIAKSKAQRTVRPRSNPSEVESQMRPAVSKTIMATQQFDAPKSLPKNVDELLLERVQEATALIKESRPVQQAVSNNERLDRTTVRTLMIDDNE